MRRRLVTLGGLALLLGACTGVGSPTPITHVDLGTATPGAATDTPGSAGFATITLTGTGSKVPKFTIPGDQAAIAVVSEKGTGNFIVESLDGTGATTGLLVNTIGAYGGTALFDAAVLSPAAAFKVTANGTWTIKVEPTSAARPWAGSAKLTGKGDDVVRLTVPPRGLQTATMTHAGTRNFIVYAYTSNGLPNVLANEIGKFSGQVQLPDGTALLAITADGIWTITPD